MSIEPFIKCSDISNSVSFYTNVLDFKVQTPPDPDKTSVLSKYAVLVRDKNLVHLSEHEGDGVFGNVIYVRVKDIEKLYDQIYSRSTDAEKEQKHTAVNIALTVQSWGMTEFSVNDPDGNKITFGQDTES